MGAPKKVSVGRRIRSIKPELIEDELVGRLSHGAWRLFVSMFLLADDYGNMRGAHDRIRGDVFPWDSRDCHESFENIRETLGELCRAGLITSYRHAGQTYLHIAGWSKHQKVDHPGNPRVPGPNDPESQEIQIASAKDTESLANIPETLATDRDRDQDQDQSKQEQQGARARNGRTDSEFMVGVEPLPERTEYADEKASRAVGAAIREQEAAMRRLGITPPLWTGRHTTPVHDRYREQVEAHRAAGHADPAALAAADLLHVLRVREARIDAKQETAEHFNGVTNWKRGPFEFALDKQPPPLDPHRELERRQMQREAETGLPASFVDFDAIAEGRR